MGAAACQQAPSKDQSPLRTAPLAAVPCAIAGAQELTQQCGVDQEDSKAGLVLTLRHPDGGFRRLLVVRDGRGVVAADGAEASLVRVVAHNQIDVAIAGDVYRLPATVKAPTAS